MADLNMEPRTLGEYLDLCKAIGVEGNRAVVLLEKKIEESPGGRDEEVLADPSQMRMLLMPLLMDVETP